MDAARQLFFDYVARAHEFVDSAAGPAWAALSALVATAAAQLDPVLHGELFGRPGWMWLSFIGLVVLLLAFDLGVLHRSSREIEVGESLILSAGYIAIALASAPGGSGARPIAARRVSRWTSANLRSGSFGPPARMRSSGGRFTDLLPTTT